MHEGWKARKLDEGHGSSEFNDAFGFGVKIGEFGLKEAEINLKILFLVSGEDNFGRFSDALSEKIK